MVICTIGNNDNNILQAEKLKFTENEQNHHSHYGISTLLLLNIDSFRL